MGVLGTGLYAGDFAMDLRSSISAVLRLPFDAEKLVDVLCETEPGSAHNAEDPDHTVFWLVLADQFARRRVESARARDTALRIIDSGADIQMQAKLGLDPGGLKQRRKVLEEVRARLTQTVTGSKPRNVLKKPQAWLVEVGDVILYPTCHGRCINPCFKSKSEITHWIDGREIPWERTGWSAMVLVDRGRAFDFLNWYRMLTISEEVSEKPLVSDLRGGRLWRLGRPGTLTAPHAKRMEFEKIGTMAIDEDKVRAAFPAMRPGTSYAVSDITIANTMDVIPAVRPELMPMPGTIPSRRAGKPYETIWGIDQLCTY